MKTYLIISDSERSPKLLDKVIGTPSDAIDRARFYESIGYKVIIQEKR